MREKKIDSGFRLPVTTLAGSSLKNIILQTKGYRVGIKYYPKLILSVVVAAILELFAATERLVWGKRIRRHQFNRPPVFIIGFWRSGTTLMHSLMCQDRQFAYTDTFQTVFPNIILSHARWLKPLVNFLVPKKRPYDNVDWGLDYPQEEEFGLLNVQPFSIYKFYLFPADFDRIVDQELFTGDLEPASVATWEKAHHELMVKSALNTGGRVYLGKNPCHLSRIGLLRKAYPGAKFIFIHRHPYQVVESLYHFVHEIFIGVKLQDVPESFTRENIARLYVRITEAYLRDRAEIPPEDLYEVNMKSFMSDKIGHLEAIYKQFGLEGFAEARPRFEKYLSDNSAALRASDTPKAEIKEYIDRHAGHIMQELGYKPDNP